MDISRILMDICGLDSSLSENRDSPIELAVSRQKGRSNTTKSVLFVLYLPTFQYRSRLGGFPELPLISAVSVKFRVGSATSRLLKSGE